MATAAKKKPTSRTRKTTSKAEISNNQLIKFYSDMLLIRRFEEKAGQLYGMGLIGGFCHLYIGQEAVVTGMQAALNETDSIITGYRDHGHMLACGMSAAGVMAELTGREGGYSRGKGGSMHMFSQAKKFYGGHGIVAAQVPLGGGLAFAHKYRKDGGIAVAYYGDGAANQGQVAETYNMARLWNLPIIFVIENNRYAMGTSTERAAADTDFYKRGEPYDLPGVKVDGMDVEAVYREAARVVDHVRCGKGPHLMEMMTYRYRGHSMSDPAKYRTKEEVQSVRSQQDPIERLKEVLISRGVQSEEDLKAIDKDIKAQVAQSAEFAQTSPEPDPAELWKDVYSNAGQEA